MAKKVQPGQPLNIPAETWNGLQDTLEDYQRRRELGLEGGNKNDEYPTDKLKARNLSCADRSAGEVLELCGAIFTPERRNIWLTAAIPAAEGKCFGVVVRPQPLNDIDEIQVSGVALAWVSVNSLAHNRCDVIAGSTVLHSGATGPVRIVEVPSGATGLQLCVVLIESPCSETTAAPTTTLAPELPQPCSGTCVWSWHADNNHWEISSESCGQQSTTTTTILPAVVPLACYCASATTAPPATTTSAPTTTTTPDCNCLYPTYCGISDGELSQTYCAPDQNTTPPCGTTSTTTSTTTIAPTTTTTCDCSGTTTTTSTTTDAPDCSSGCKYAFLPNGAGGLSWQQLTNGCDPICACSAPTNNYADSCGTTLMPCGSIPATTQPPAPTRCRGFCEYWWIPDDGRWKYTRNTCVAGTDGLPCQCRPPSSAGSECAPVQIPCQGSGTTLDPCEWICYPTTTGAPTTTGTPTSTTAGECLWCEWEWDDTDNVWGSTRDRCDPCPCAYPDSDGNGTCERRRVPCGNTTPPPTTTTTTTTTTTSAPTTTTTTTTTTCAPGTGTRVWECVETPPGCCNGAGACKPFWRLAPGENDCCNGQATDICKTPKTPCTCSQLGFKITCPCGSTNCTTTTTSTTCAPCVDLVTAGSGCVDGADCCCSYRCDIHRRKWVPIESGVYCDECPSAKACLTSTDNLALYNSCIDGSIDPCETLGVVERCIYCSCAPCATTTTTGSPTTTTTGSPTTTCEPGCNCVYEWSGSPAFEWIYLSDNCGTCNGGDMTLCQPPLAAGSTPGELSNGDADCCGL